MGKKQEGGQAQPTPQPVPIPGTGVRSGSQPQSFAGFQQFAQTGGFSPEDLANIRARAVSPVRATYANAQREVNRQRAIQGGYSPGFGVLQARMAREQGQTTSDAATNAEAGIAEMVQKGKLAGLQGMAGTEGSGGGGGAGMDNLPQELVPEQKKGFWGKLWGGLKKVGQVALPIAAGALTGGFAAPVTAGLTGLGGKLGAGALSKIGLGAAGQPSGQG